jgi:hypothetical protein
MHNEMSPHRRERAQLSRKGLLFPLADCAQVQEVLINRGRSDSRNHRGQRICAKKGVWRSPFNEGTKGS